MRTLLVAVLLLLTPQLSHADDTKGIIADTPFLVANARGQPATVTLVDLPSKLELAGLSTFEEMWTVDPSKLEKLLGSMTVEVNGKKMQLSELDPGAAGRLTERLRTTRTTDGAAKISAAALTTVVGPPAPAPAPSRTR